MRRFWGFPPGLLRLGEYTYRCRGQVDFQISREGCVWWCHGGYQLPPSLSDKRFNRAFGLPANDRGLLSTMREDGWGSFTKNALLRKVNRAIERDLERLMHEDAREIEARGVGMGYL